MPVRQQRVVAFKTYNNAGNIAISSNYSTKAISLAGALIVRRQRALLQSVCEANHLK